jgi:hypothetical protein
LTKKYSRDIGTDTKKANTGAYLLISGVGEKHDSGGNTDFFSVFTEKFAGSLPVFQRCGHMAFGLYCPSKKTMRKIIRLFRNRKAARKRKLDNPFLIW